MSTAGVHRKYFGAESNESNRAPQVSEDFALSSAHCIHGATPRCHAVMRSVIPPQSMTETIKVNIVLPSLLTN